MIVTENIAQDWYEGFSTDQIIIYLSREDLRERDGGYKMVDEFISVSGIRPTAWDFEIFEPQPAEEWEVSELISTIGYPEIIQDEANGVMRNLEQSGTYEFGDSYGFWSNNVCNYNA